MAAQGRQGGADRTGKYGGGDGALEHEREKIQPDEDPGGRRVPTGTGAAPGQSAAVQAERQQERDLASGEENPG